MKKRRTSPLLPAAVVLGAVLCLSGCSRVADVLHKVHEESFPDRSTAERNWRGVPAPEWLPPDSIDIHNLATINESYSVILVRSSSDLPAGCVRTARKEIPFDARAWTPELDSFPDTVQRCGDYEVMRVTGGWLGWFSATEQGQKPSAVIATN